MTVSVVVLGDPRIGAVVFAVYGGVRTLSAAPVGFLIRAQGFSSAGRLLVGMVRRARVISGAATLVLSLVWVSHVAPVLL
jgi:hypothetical protein